MVTMKDVAKRAGVSVSTVSRALSGCVPLAPETMTAVINAVAELDYVVNPLAQSLKSRRTETIVVLIPSIKNQIFPDIVRGIEDLAASRGYTVILGNTDESVYIESTYIKKLQTRFVDGYIVASMSNDSGHILEMLENEVPIVFLARFKELSDNAVAIDNRLAAYRATQYLIESGHQNIAIALGPEELPIYRYRLLGYQEALAEAGRAFREELVMRDRRDNREHYLLTKELLKRERGVDAIFATSDVKAIFVMRALHDLGIKIPEEISVMGFDDIELADVVEPPLTTVRQPLYAMGQRAAEKLIDMIEYKMVHKVLPEGRLELFETEIVTRKSTRDRRELADA